MRYILILATFLLSLTLRGQSSYETKVDSLKNIVSKSRKESNLSNAISAQKKLSQLHKTEKGVNSGYYIAAKANLARLYQFNGEHKKAVKTLNNLLPIYIDNYGEDEDIPSLYNWLGLSYNILHQYAKATVVFKKGLNYFVLHPENKNDDYDYLTSNLASAYRSLGLYDSAIFYSKLALEFIRSTKGIDSYQLFAPNQNIGLAYTDLGNYAKAERYLNIAKGILLIHKKENSENYAGCMLNLGLLYKKTYNYNQAIKHYNSCLSTLENIDKTQTRYYASALNNLGVVYHSKKENRKAVNYLWSAFKIRRILYGDNSLPVAKTFMGLGIAYDDMGMKDSSIKCYTKSVEIEDAFGNNDLTTRLRVLYKKGLINIANDNHLGAAIYLEEELKLIAENYGTLHQSYSKTLSTLAFLYATEKPEKAIETLIKAIKVKKEYLKSIFNYLPQDELSTYLIKQAYDDNELAASLLTKKDNSKLKTALLNNLLFLKGAILKNNSDVFKTIKSTQNNRLEESYNQYIALQKKLGIIYSTPAKERKANIDSLYRMMKVYEKSLIKQSAQYRDQSYLFETNWKDVQSKLDANEAAIEFVRFTQLTQNSNEGEWYAALIIRKEFKEPQFILLSKEKDIKDILTKVSPQALFANRSNELLEEADIIVNYHKKLYQLVWQKLEPSLKNCEKIFFSPDGILHQVAFNALPVSNTELLIDKYFIERHLSLRNIKTNRVFNNNSITIFGGLDYEHTSSTTTKVAQNLTPIPQDRDRGSSFNYLKGTYEEALAIQQLINTANVNLYSGEMGSEENFKKLSGKSPLVLHLATHGFFLPKKDKKRRNSFEDNVFEAAENPLMRSGLVLSGGNKAWKGELTKGIEDGILTAYEVSALDLSNTKLVVLSACQTGLGDVKETEGVYGLQRAFKMAGVNQIIMSLWSVPDKETKELMELFYKEVNKTNNIRLAFANAQKIMRTKYAPYYWAAFVLVE